MVWEPIILKTFQIPNENKCKVYNHFLNCREPACNIRKDDGVIKKAIKLNFTAFLNCCFVVVVPARIELTSKV